MRGKGCAVGGACIAQPAGVRRRCVGEQKCLGGRVAVRGREEAFGGEWVVRSAGLTHIRRSSTRARVLLYIRPPCPRREIAAMGPKDAPASTHRPRRLPHPPRPRLHFRARVHTSPAKPSAPAPSVFAFSYPRSHFPRIAFRGPRGAIGLPQQQLSTMGYPRKSYPHRCSPPCAKRSRPRACARVYIIYRSPVGRSRGVSAPLRKRVRAVVPPCPAPPCAGWGRAKAKADAPSRSAEPCRLCAESLCAKAEVHKANPAPARALSPQQLVYGRAPARLCAESLCAKAEVHKANPAPARALSPREPAYGRAPAL